MNTPRPILTRIKTQLKKPVFLGPLAFIAGSFWIHTILNNFNSEKIHSSLFRGIMNTLVLNDRISKAIGSNIEYDDSKRVKGGFDNFKGTADLEFQVKGKNGTGTVLFKGKRFRETDCWISDQFEVVIDGEGVSMKVE